MSATTPCVEWDRARNAAGYGIRRVNGACQLAHRVAYCEANQLPLSSISGMVIRHTCDNRACIAESHLLAGTQADNVRDTVERGRLKPTRGERHPGAKLTQQDVEFIRANHLRGSRWSPSRCSSAELASRFGISTKQVLALVAGKAWGA